MKILFFTHYSDLYGANLSMLYLAEDLKNRYGVDISFVCPKQGRFVKRAREMGFDVFVMYYIPWETNRLLRIKKIFRKIINPVTFQIVIKHACCVNPDIVYSNSSICDLGIRIAKKINRPCVWHIREYGFDDYDMKFMVNHIEVEKLFSSAARLIAVSDDVRCKYADQYNLNNIVTIHNGIKPFQIEHREHKKVHFCCVGRLIENKGQKDIILAAIKLKEKYHDRFNVFFIGEGEQHYTKLLDKLVDENNMNGIIKFCGHADRIEDVLSDMDVGIMSSKREAFGRVTVEYMLAEMCVIATNTPTNSEILKNDGVFYNYGNYEELANAMEYFIVNNPEIKLRKENLLYRARTEFTQIKCTDNINQILEMVK